MIKKLHPDFPVYVIKNWHSIEGEQLDSLIKIILKNKEKHTIPGGASFWLQDDEDGRFKQLYNKFYNFVNTQFGLTATVDNYNICNVYHSNNVEASEVIDSQGRLFYHSHKHVVSKNQNSTTVVGVYYATVPDTKSGFIDFKIDEVMTDNGYVSAQSNMEYHQLNREPYIFIEKVRESRSKEISYQPQSGDLVLFPSYLDHRPQRSLVEGHRVAINFELKTGEHPDESFAKIAKVYLNQ
jgi:hypothetical protein